MAKKKDVVRYKCMNFGACAKANADEVIEFPSMDVLGGTPPCPCCKQNTLEEIGGGTDPGLPEWVKYVGIGVGALAVLGGGGFGIYKAFAPSHPKEVTLNHYEKTLFVGDKDTLRATLSPTKSEGTLEWKSSKDGVLDVDDGIVTALKEGKGKIRVSVKDVDGVEAICEYTIEKKKEDKPEDVLSTEEVDSLIKGKAEPINKPEVPSHVKPVNPPTKPVVDKPAQKPTTTKPAQKPTTSKPAAGINLGYGVYRGETLNGKPHGHGVITFKRTHRLISSKDYIAEPGDKYEGEFRNGQISGGMGYLYHDGDIIGVKP